MADYAGRIARLQEAMRQEGAAVTLLSATDQMRYLTGWTDHPHKRLIGLFVPAESEPTFVVPAMYVEPVRRNPAGLKQIVGWNDEEGWLDKVKILLASW